MGKTVFDFAATGIDGKPVDLSAYRGRVLLIVNTASKCGFTPQYKGLQKLFEQYRERGLEVLGFPCDQFGHQEPGSETDINSFCELNFGVSFPLFAKIEVNGKEAHPLFAHLKSAAPGLLDASAIVGSQATRATGTIGDLYLAVANKAVGAGLKDFPTASRPLNELFG